MSKEIIPRIQTHIYPIVASDTNRLIHTGVPKNVSQSSYTKQLEMLIERNPTSDGKCIATLDNEILEEVRVVAHGDLVPGSWDLQQTGGVSQQPWRAGIDPLVGQRIAITNKRVWMVAFNFNMPSGSTTGIARIYQDGTGNPGTLIASSNGFKSVSTGWNTFVFDNCPNLNGTYRIVVENSGGNNGFLYYTSSDVITGNRCWFDATLTTWVDPTGDMQIRLNYLPDAYLKVYKNGSPIGSEFKNIDAADFVEVDLSDDLGPFDPGDTVELWGYIDNSVAGGGNHTFDITSFRLRYDWDSTKIKGAASYS